MKCPRCHFDNPDSADLCKKCGTKLGGFDEALPSVTKTLRTQVRRLEAGSLFAGRYEVLDELGKGGMGVVYRVKDQKLDEEMALKVLKPEIAAHKEIIERFKNELKFARKIAHRHVCKMYDLDEEEDILYITMEYVKGKDLKSFIGGKIRLAQEEAIPIAKQVCEGLVEAHDLGVIHRDLKPQNIMIDERGQTKIMDFGIARSISQKIKVKLTLQEETRFVSAGQVNPETYKDYLRGMSLLNGSTDKEFDEGMEILRRAVEKNPADPLSYIGLGYGYASLGHSPSAPPDAWQQARAAAERALKLDPNLAEGYAIIADIKTYYERDWKGAEQNFRRAMELNPSLALNHYHYAWYLALMKRMDEAIAEHKRAQELDPMTPPHTAWLGGLYWYDGQYDKAIAEAQKCFKMREVSALGLLITGYGYAGKGMYEEAIAAHRKLAEVTPRFKYALGRTYALAGKKDEARKILAELEKEEPSPFGAWALAIMYASLGENDKAFQALAYEPSHAWIPWFSVDPQFHTLRDDPRFKELERKFNLPET